MIKNYSYGSKDCSSPTALDADIIYVIIYEGTYSVS